jgi:hypothetical protein
MGGEVVRAFRPREKLSFHLSKEGEDLPTAYLHTSLMTL